MLKNKKDVGDYGENAAAGYLIGKGYVILERNYRRGGGEIDIIANDKEYIVFVEVKYRKSMSAGYPREAVSRAKQKRIIETALYYIGENSLDDNDFRFDVIEVFGKELLDINHIENAFDA